MTNEERLEKIENHLNIAISELGEVCGKGGVWIGSWGDYRKLVKLKLRLEGIRNKAEYEKSKRT